MTLNEIQEAAKVITESIDPDAKVIFGTIKDDKLKKGEIRITVIASGFPEDQVISSSSSSSIFNFANNQKPAEPANEKPAEVKPDVKTPEREKPSGSIFNTVSPKSRTEKPAEATSKPEAEPSKEDDDWSSVPAFLRRNRNK